jgi:probable rRNA maturation factor
MNVSIEIAIEALGWTGMPSAQAAIRRAVEAAVADAGPPKTEIGIVLADDERVRALNRTWLGEDKPTNVLSFPAPDRPGNGPRFLGDVVFALETIRREAEAEDKPFDYHLSHLAVHGVLHLLGFDHARDADADAMENRERRILAQLGIPDPYAPAGERRREPA